MARSGDGIYQRGRTWYLDCRIHGTRHVHALGKGISRTVAKELASVERGAILKAEAGIGKKKKDCRFEKARAEFEKWALSNKRPRTYRTYTQCLNHLARSFNGKQLSEIHPFGIEKHKRDRAEAGARVRANREVAVLKMLFNRAKEWNLFDGDNPVSGVVFFEEPQQRLRYLEPEEEARLVNAAPEPLRSLIVLGINTGLRLRAEALTLRWDDVDLKRGLLTVQAAYAKSGQTRTIPLNTAARSALEQLSRLQTSDYVFAKSDGNPYKCIGKSFKKLAQQVGLHDVTPHVLRHTFASRLAMAGIDVRTIQELGGWGELSMVERYSHLSPNHKAQAVERISGIYFPSPFTTAENLPLATAS